MKDLPKTWVSSNNRLKISDKKIKNSRLGMENKKKKHKTSKAKTEHGPCKQEEINRSKLEKSIQIQTVGTLQD